MCSPFKSCRKNVFDVQCLHSVCMCVHVFEDYDTHDSKRAQSSWESQQIRQWEKHFDEKVSITMRTPTRFWTSLIYLVGLSERCLTLRPSPLRSTVQSDRWIERTSASSGESPIVRAGHISKDQAFIRELAERWHSAFLAIFHRKENLFFFLVYNSVHVERFRSMLKSIRNQTCLAVWI